MPRVTVIHKKTQPMGFARRDTTSAPMVAPPTMNANVGGGSAAMLGCGVPRFSTRNTPYATTRTIEIPHADHASFPRRPAVAVLEVAAEGAEGAPPRGPTMAPLIQHEA